MDDERLETIQREIRATLIRGDVYGWKNEIDSLRRIAGVRVSEIADLLRIAREDAHGWKFVAYALSVIAGMGWGLYAATLLGR